MHCKEMERLQMELLQERERYSMLLSMNTSCFFEYDMEGDSIVFTKNNIISQWSGRVIADYSKQLSKELFIHKEDKNKLLAFFRLCVDGKLEFRILDEDGEIHWRFITGARIGDIRTGLQTFNGCITDIDIVKKEQERKERIEKQDALTELYNQKSTKEQIKKYLENEGEQGCHAFMIIDIDHFEKVNRKLGRVFGDAVLKNIADNLKNIFYTSDILGRIGGDEFLVFLKNTDNIHMLREKAEWISKAFADTYTGEDKELKITCSIGITRYPQDGYTYEELFRKTDIALYQAKEQGFGSIILYEKASSSNFLLSEDAYFNEYQKEYTSTLEYYDLDREITDFASDIMAKTKDVTSAVNLLIGNIGKKFHADYIYIMERKEKNRQLKLSYLWDSKNGIYSFEQIKKREIQSLELEQDYFDKCNMYVLENIEESECYAKKKPIQIDSNTRSILQCGFYDAGDWRNLIGVETFSKERKWTNRELESIQSITKIISFYLYKLRISEEMEKKLDFMKNYDMLTGLPTLYKFKKDVKQTIEQNPNRTFTIVYSDISGFKYINDTYGYKAGDRLLCDYAEFIVNASPEIIHAARISADIFIILISIGQEEEIKEFVLNLNERFLVQQKEKNSQRNPIVISGACIIYSQDDIVAAIDNANIARKRAKSSTKPTCKLYDELLDIMIRKEQNITNSMERALAKGEFKVFLQPKLDVKRNCLAGAEALVRWEKDGILMPPNDFIPLFEKNGFIIKLDFYVYEEVCKLISHWREEGMPIVPISLNVSRVHLNEKDFTKKIKAIVDKYQIPYSWIEMELTESTFLNNTNIALMTMKELRATGFGVSIDDFGAGYSSLNLLKDMTTDVLKLDKGFFQQGDMKKKEKIIVSSIVNMAKQLDMKVLSEGVETRMQYEFLKEIDCDLVQGYLYARPKPVSEFEQLLIKREDTKIVLE